MTLEEVQVAQESDDAEGNETSPFAMNTTSSDLELQNAGSDGSVGIVFDPVDVPKDATITDAKIQFTVDEITAPGNSDPLTVTWEIELIDDAPTFTTTDGDINDRTAFGTTVDWVIPTWVATGDALAAQLTVDLKVLVQEIVDRAGWATGQAMAFMIRTQVGTGSRVADAYDGGAAGRAKLIINYTTVSFKIEGDVRDLSLDTVGTVRCILLKHDGAAEASRIYSIIAHVNANGSGLYSFTGLTDNDARYCVIAYNDEATDRRGATSDNLTPVTE